MELHVTRAASWVSSPDAPISADEWRAAAAALGLEPASVVTARSPAGDVIEIGGDFAWWRDSSGTEALSAWRLGRVDVSVDGDAGPGALAVLKDLARRLRARLVDDADAEVG